MTESASPAPEPLPRLAPPAPVRSRRRVWVARGVSVVLHAAVIALLIYRFPALIGAVRAPDRQPEVELVMVEKKGNDRPSPPTPSPPAPQKPATAPPARKAAPAPSKPAPPTPAPPPTEQAPAKAATREKPQPDKTRPAKQAATRPTPPKPSPSPQAAPPQPQVQVNLGGNNPATNAIVSGGQVVPASPDAAYHNREPAYPISAARRGEQGAVLVMIHVAPDGHADDVDILHSSGYPALDQAAVKAVRTWHFLPALRNGQPVESSFPFRVVFALD